MNLLAFETATPSGGAALIQDGVLEGSVTVRGGASHSKLCLRAAETLLDASGITWQDLDAAVASHGPGSFTGIRIGLALLKGLAFSLKIRPLTVSSLESLAWQSAERGYPGPVVPILDARQGEYYAAIYRWNNKEELEADGDELCLSQQQLIKAVPENALISGEGGVKAFDDLAKKIPGIQLARMDRRLASPAATAILGERMLSTGQETSIEEIRPQYLRQVQFRTKFAG